MSIARRQGSRATAELPITQREASSGSASVADGRTLADRDYLSFNAKYTF